MSPRLVMLVLVLAVALYWVALALLTVILRQMKLL